MWCSRWPKGFAAPPAARSARSRAERATGSTRDYPCHGRRAGGSPPRQHYEQACVSVHAGLRDQLVSGEIPLSAIVGEPPTPDSRHCTGPELVAQLLAHWLGHAADVWRRELRRAAPRRGVARLPRPLYPARARGARANGRRPRHAERGEKEGEGRMVQRAERRANAADNARRWRKSLAPRLPRQDSEQGARRRGGGVYDVHGVTAERLVLLLHLAGARHAEAVGGRGGARARRNAAADALHVEQEVAVPRRASYENMGQPSWRASTRARAPRSGSTPTRRTRLATRRSSCRTSSARRYAVPRARCSSAC